MRNDRDEEIPRTDGLADREPGEIVLRAERIVAPAPAPEIRDLEYNRHAPTKPEMFPYGVDWWMVALAIVVVIFSRLCHLSQSLGRNTRALRISTLE